MNTSRNILFLCKEQSPMVNFIQKWIKNNHPKKFEPFVFSSETNTAISYKKGCNFVGGVSFEFFGGLDDVLGDKRAERLSKKYKVWAEMGGNCNPSWTINNKRYLWPMQYFEELCDAMLKSKINNDVHIICFMGSGDYRVARPKCIYKNIKRLNQIRLT